MINKFSVTQCFSRLQVLRRLASTLHVLSRHGTIKVKAEQMKFWLTNLSPILKRCEVASAGETGNKGKRGVEIDEWKKQQQQLKERKYFNKFIDSQDCPQT